MVEFSSLNYLSLLYNKHCTIRYLMMGFLILNLQLVLSSTGCTGRDGDPQHEQGPHFTCTCMWYVVTLEWWEFIIPHHKCAGNKKLMKRRCFCQWFRGHCQFVHGLPCTDSCTAVHYERLWSDLHSTYSEISFCRCSEGTGATSSCALKTPLLIMFISTGWRPLLFPANHVQ